MSLETISYAVQTNATRKLNTMKEKTFEELIIQLFPNHELTKDRWSFELMQFSADDLIEFGIQVREATIAECSTKVFHFLGNSPESFEICAIIDELPTDRIKTEK